LALQNISKSYSYLVAKDDHEGVSKLGNSIEKSTSGLLDVVNRLLDWSNSIKTRKTIIQPCLVGSVVEQVLVDLRTPIENKQLLVEKELRGDMRISSERESLVNSVQGLGIGLQICKHIVTRLNATMQIEQNLPKGTKVTVTLPQRMN